MNPALVAEMLKPRDEEIEELENIATAEWQKFDPDTRRCAYEFILWAQSRARHTLNRILSGDVTAPLPEDVKLVQVGPCSCSDHECGECMKPDLVKRLRKMSAENKSPRDCIDDAADEIERLRNIEAAAVACSEHPVWNDDHFYGLMINLQNALRGEVGAAREWKPTLMAMCEFRAKREGGE